METAMHIAHFGPEGGVKPQDGDLITLVARVRHYDDSDNTFQFDVIDPVDHSKTECVDTFIGINYVCRPSPSAYPIERSVIEAKLKALDAARADLLKDLGTLNTVIGDREPL